MARITISELKPEELPASLQGLAEVFHASVNAGASVSFVLPHSPADSRAFWRNKVFPSVQAGRRILLVAWQGGKLAGTVQLDLDLPPNQAHRSEVAKLLVHPACRRQGIAKALMEALEQRARDLDKRLITLDTRTGDTAEPLYRALGYQTAGVIPGYSRAPEADRYDSTTYMYKAL